MSEIQRFRAASTVTVSAMAHDIWAVWVDVNAWSNWNDGVEHTEMRENFKAGTVFLLTPRGGKPVQTTITTATQGEEFSDETRFPFGVLQNRHRMTAIDDRVLLTHEVEAQIDRAAARTFATEVWPGLQNGVATTVANIADIVSDE